jgi:ribosomal-protein-alanine N-acetyltransferase
MTITTEPWLSPATSNRRVQLVQIPAPVIHALADGSLENLGGDRGLGVLESGTLYTPYIRGPECQSLWAIRSAQIAAHPGDSAWITRLVVVPGIPGAVGVAGFHAPPDDREMVEFGYRIEPTHRRQGYARAALEALLSVARHHAQVRVIRATISPDNSPSRSLVAQYGFVEVGEQWDDEDGLEIIFELAA